MILPFLRYGLLNRFYRRALDQHYRSFQADGRLTDEEEDDIDNLYNGCAFE